jgi:uncharacterized protein (TIGR03000 family)
MNRNMKLWLAVGGMAAMLFAPTANAQHGGGGHGGGGHGGGMSAGHSGGGSWHGGSGGNWHGGSGGNWHGGNYYHNGYYHNGYYHYGYGYYPFGIAIGLGFGWPYYGGYGGYGGVAYGDGVYVSSYTPDYGYGAVNYGQTVALDSAQNVPPSQNASMSAYPLTPDKVRMLVVLPSPDVRLTINGQSTEQQGTDRLFDSPSMQPGKAYVYKLQATWTKDGHEITRTKNIDVETGKVYTIVFRFDAETAPPPVSRPQSAPPVANPQVY